ncbi:unnamed protein product [Ectocarpus sp. CCAP 1310/34]|nr:unnamed protein product [Ectocarpus sp. CCAP 1310/34]
MEASFGSARNAYTHSLRGVWEECSDKPWLTKSAYRAMVLPPISAASKGRTSLI